KPALTIPICGANYVRSKPRPKSEVRHPQSERAQTACVSDLHARPGNDVSLKQGDPNSVARNNVEVAGQVGKPLVAQNQQGDGIEKVSPILPGSSLSAELTVSDSRLADAFKATQENLLALQRLAEQTAQVHRQFLEGQDKTLQVFQALLAQQQALISPHRGVDTARAPVLPTPGDSKIDKTVAAAAGDSPAIVTTSP